MEFHPSDHDLVSITWDKVFNHAGVDKHSEEAKRLLECDGDSVNLHRLLIGNEWAQKNIQILIMNMELFSKISEAAFELLKMTDTIRRKVEKNLLAPSEYGKRKEYDPNVHDHRTSNDTDDGHSLHIGLQMQLFGNFIDRMRGNDEIQEKYYLLASELMQEMSGYFRYESMRVEKCSSILCYHLKWEIRSFSTDHSRSSSDRTVLFQTGYDTHVLMNYEFKNEFSGNSSCPVKQNIGYFQTFKQGKSDRSPMLLISFVGPHYLQVFGAVWNGGVTCVDPLSKPVSLLYVRRDPNHSVSDVAKVFAAIDFAIEELKEYYSTPYRNSVFGIKGPYYGLDKYVYRSGSFGNRLWLFKAKSKMDCKEYVVKFVRSKYGDNPHRLLAENGYAPQLIECQPLSGGWIAVVMELMNGCTLASYGKPNLCMIESIRKATSLMHDKGYVHGDLRPQNIIVNNQSVYIVDFDWAGQCGEARYPVELIKPSMYLAEDRWHSSVRCGGLIEKEHDCFQINKLELLVC